MTQFTPGWKVAIIVALVASCSKNGRFDRQKQANLKYEKRMEEMEKSIKKIETYLYDTVATSDSKNKQRLSEIEKSLKEIGEHAEPLEKSK